MRSGWRRPCGRRCPSRSGEALKLKVIDLIADSLPDLLEKIDGRVVKTKRAP